MSAELAAQVADARAALAALGLPVDALDAAWGSPWTVVLLGGEGVGKTTLVNRLTETAAPTGLGGVTRAPREVALPSVTLLDLPAIGGPTWPGGRSATADAAIWLVDGLQPLPVSEVEAVARSGCPARLHVRVTRLDLVEADQADDVLERVRARLARFKPDSVGRLDPRRDPLPWSLLVRAGAGTARCASLQATVTAIRSGLPTPDPDEPVQAWRHAARRAADRLDTEPLEAITRATSARLVAQTGALGLPAPPPDPTTPLRQLVSGETRARRDRRAAFAGWAAEVEVVLREHHAARQAPLRALERALDALELTLTPAAGTLSGEPP